MTVIALADDEDLLATVPLEDLRELLEIAAVQVDSVDEDEAAGYGLTPADTDRLHTAARRLLTALS